MLVYQMVCDTAWAEVARRGPLWRSIHRRTQEPDSSQLTKTSTARLSASRADSERDCAPPLDAERCDETQDEQPKSLTFLTSLFATMPPLLWYVPQSRTQASRNALFFSPCARWHARMASCVKLTAGSVVNVISSCSPSTGFPTGIGVGWWEESNDGRREVI